MENKLFEIVKGKTDADLLEMVYEFDRWDAEMLAAVGSQLEKRNLRPADLSHRREMLVEKEHENLEKGREASLRDRSLDGWAAWVCSG